MRKSSFLCVGVILLVLGGLLAVQAGISAWKGTVATEDGIKVVKNPSDPLYGEFVFDLREDLRLGGDPNREASYFPTGALLAVDASGNLFVTDWGNGRVQMFDKNGAFVRTIGRRGQGPGEYMSPSGIHFDAEGSVWVDGGPQWVVFSKDGHFLKKAVVSKFMRQKMLDPGGAFIGTTQPTAALGEPKHELIRVEPDGKTFRTLAEFRGEISQAKRAISYHWYSNSIQFAPVGPDAFVYGFTDEYKLYIADAEGRTTLVLTKDEKPQSISGSEKDKTRKDGVWAVTGSNNPEEGIFFPDHRPYFSRLMADDAGRIYVFRFKSILEEDAPTRVDVFSREGVYLYRMTGASRPAAIRAGFLYEVREDPETSEYLVIRQKITNWEGMKAR